MTESVIAHNVRRIRSFKGLSQEAVAKKSEISRATYRNIENGKTTPRVNTLLSIAETLGVKLEDLVESTLPLSTVRFRCLKKIKMHSREQILVNVATWLRDYKMLEDLAKDEEKKKLIFRKCRSLLVKGVKDPEIMAASAREDLDLKKERDSITDICDLMVSGGIKVFPYAVASEGFFGLSVSEKEGGPAIIVNVWDRIPVERWIFSTAHELGHIILHHNSFDVKVSEEDQKEETEANAFASYFLMPKSRFNEEWKLTYGLHFVDRVFKVKRIFKVSYRTILKRLEETPYFDNSIWMKFNVMYKQKFNRTLGGKVEPQPMNPYDFQENRLNFLIRKAIQSEQITSHKGAQILRISLEKMKERASCWDIA
ncbi:MAG: ImmA/IrrE family metallo-endopeptidase [Candidatus Anammoxibacter sp.]